MHLKRKGKLFRQIIDNHCHELTTFPLAKGGTTYPFRFSTVPAHFWTLAKKRFGRPFTDSRIYAMLDMLKEYTFDLIQSQELQTCSAYDMQKIKLLVEKYYAGERQLSHELDWFLSFEFWRQSMRNYR
jgi:hypothetical protein